MGIADPYQSIINWTDRQQCTRLLVVKHVLIHVINVFVLIPLMYSLFPFVSCNYMNYSHNDNLYLFVSSHATCLILHVAVDINGTMF